MIDYYNAFISYKHAPLDSKVAEHVQRSLEHFYIPHKIRQKTGRKRIERIFRDKDELPITSDLTDTIANALQKAEYLIVICSPNTKESIWVKREISFFLKNHKRSQILTVLAEGEPVDVIPDELKYDEQEIIDFRGMTTTVKVPKEPLSCDYRMPFSKAKREEIPRLAAALIGCSYDELVRRQRAYKMRRVILLSTLFASAALLFGVYMYNSKKKVDESYRNALINQSRYLATESVNELNEQRRVEALYLALGALPQGEDDPRPVNDEAIAALSNADYAYRCLHGSSVDSVWNYSVGSSIMDFRVNDAGTRLVALDDVGVITVWDTETHSKLFEITDPHISFATICFADDSTLVLLGDNNILGYDLDSGDSLYDIETDVTVSHEDIMVIDRGRMLVATWNNTLLEIDYESGDIIKEYNLQPERGEYEFDFPFAFYSLSPDLKKVGFRALTDTNSSKLGVFDLTTETVTYSETLYSDVIATAWADNTHLVAASFRLTDVESSRMNDTYVLHPDTTQIYCCESRNMDIVWENEIVSTSLVSNTLVMPLPANNMVIVCTGNKVNCYDNLTGELLYEWYCNDTVADISDRDGDGWPLILTQTGGMIFPLPSQSNNSVSLQYVFIDHIYKVQVCHGAYALGEDLNQIIYYNTFTYDENWNEIDDLVTDYPAAAYLDDNVLAIISGFQYTTAMTLIDPNDSSLIATIDLGGDDSFSSDYRILGVEDETLYVVKVGISDGLRVYAIDITDGSYDVDTYAEGYASTSCSATYDNGNIAYLSGTPGDYEVVIQPAGGGRSQNISVPVTDAYTMLMSPVLSDELGVVYVASQNGDYLVDTDTDDYTHVDLPDTWLGTGRAIMDVSRNRVVVSDCRDIIFLDADSGEILNTIAGGGMKVLGYDFLMDEESGTDILVVVYAEGYIYRYDASTCELIGISEISTYTNYMPEVTMEADFENGFLYVQQEELTNIISLGSWVELAHIEQSFGHHASTDRFYTYGTRDTDSYTIGYFDHYSMQDLIDRANELLENTPMPESLRSNYGL